VVADEDDDVDGDGVTTGGVVFDVDDVSRLHPATPRTTPLASSTINAVFIAISNRVESWVAPRGFSRIGAMQKRVRDRSHAKNRPRNQCCRHSTTRNSRARRERSADARSPICIGGR
jgi:hypothetical protein